MYCCGISLRRFHERYAYLSQHLAAVWGPNCEITGFEGPVPDPNAPFQPDLTAGQIGCAMSHMSAYERMIALDLPHALIVEDEVILPPQIHQIVAGIEATLRPGDVVLLFNWTETVGPFSTVDAVTVGEHRLCLPMDMSSLGTTGAYVITRSAAEGILRANRPVAVTSDNWSYFFERDAITRGRALLPNAVSRKPFESTIFTSRSKIMAFLKGSPLLRPLFTARRRVLEERIASRTLFVDET